jgi:hypothetical protein
VVTRTIRAIDPLSAAALRWIRPALRREHPMGHEPPVKSCPRPPLHADAGRVRRQPALDTDPREIRHEIADPLASTGPPVALLEVGLLLLRCGPLRHLPGFGLSASLAGLEWVGALASSPLSQHEVLG